MKKLMRINLLVCATLAAAACSKTDSAPTGFGVNVTVDATAVYWTNRGGVGAPEGAVLRLTPK